MTLTADEVRARLDAIRAHDLPVHGGRTLAYVYDAGRPDVEAVATQAIASFAGTNGLDPTAFPSLATMEREVVAFTAALLDAPPGFAGTVTSGGTESCLLAVLAAREARRDVDRPQVVAPTTVHAAFHKAAHLFGLDLELVDVDPVTFRADPAATAAALTDRSVLVVVSAPSYAHGVVDPVTPIAAAAAEQGIRCHVDACIGGFVLPFLRAAEPSPPAWSFAVPGVTSVSADLHKYGYAPKGVSVLVHRSSALRHSQFWATAAWPGYGVINSTLQSTKSGGPLAAAWATIAMIGDEGYATLAATARSAATAIADAVNGLPGLRLLAVPDSTLVALATDGSCDIYTLCDELLARGWYTQPQLPFRGGEASLHLSLSAASAAHLPDFLVALGEAVSSARAAGPAAVDPGLAAMLGSLDPASLDDATVSAVLAAAGLAGDDGGVELPERMAPVQVLLAACPPALREALLIAVVERL
jgi:glutamate/tyrosine decarboxylase-like PLP-dependent enzyme